MSDDEESGTILGIDPGLDGGVAWITSGQAEARVTPTLGVGQGGRRRLDAPAMVAMLRDRPVGLAVIEAVSAAPVHGRVQGTASMFNFGRGAGPLGGDACVCKCVWSERCESSSGTRSPACN